MLAASLLACPPVRAADAAFIRGDANMDGTLSLADVFAILRYMHQGRTLPCLDAADADDSGGIEAVDFLCVMAFLFLRDGAGNAPPPPPFPAPGLDPTPDALDCREARNPSGRRAKDEEPLVLPLDPDSLGTACESSNLGADAEFIHFLHQDIFAFPGQREVRTPVVMCTLGELDGITISLSSSSPAVRLESIDFRDGELDGHRTPLSWISSCKSLVADGYISSTFAIDIWTGSSTLPAFRDRRVADLVFSVPPDAQPDTHALVRFETTPGNQLFPPIRNEFVRSGESLRHGSCGVRIHIKTESDLFIRGDGNRDGRVNLADAALTILYLFRGDVTSPPCEDAADVDNSGRIELSDPIRLLVYLFLDGPPPAPPFPYPGQDIYGEEDLLGCSAELP